MWSAFRGLGPDRDHVGAQCLRREFLFGQNALAHVAERMSSFARNDPHADGLLPAITGHSVSNARLVLSVCLLGAILA